MKRVLGWLALSAVFASTCCGVTTFPTTGLHDYGYQEPFRHWSTDILYIHNTLVDYLATKADVDAAHGTCNSLHERLDISLNGDGTLKATAAADIMTIWLTETRTVECPVGQSTYFTVTGGDYTETYCAQRKLLLHISGGWVYTRVSSSSHDAGITTVTLPGSVIDSSLDIAKYSLVPDDRVLPKFTHGLEANTAAIDGTLAVGGAATLSSTLAVTGESSLNGGMKLPTGAALNKVLGCADAFGTAQWVTLGTLGLDPDSVMSWHIAPANPLEEGMDENSGYGIKTAHMKDKAVTLAKLEDDLKTGSTCGYGLVPRGAILMWSGTVATIPSGWALCNGSNGTPDLRDRFVVGAKQDDAGQAKTNITGALTKTGGNASLTHQHDPGTYTGADHRHQMSHTHGLPDYLRSVTTGGPNRTVNVAAGSNYGVATNIHTHTWSLGANGWSTLSMSTIYTEYAANAITGKSANTTLSTLPSYYALAYIMKL